jgi:hypothetical protein
MHPLAVSPRGPGVGSSAGYWLLSAPAAATKHSIRRRAVDRNRAIGRAVDAVRRNAP